jgi:hypothetical protein
MSRNRGATPYSRRQSAVPNYWWAEVWMFFPAKDWGNHVLDQGWRRHDMWWELRTFVGREGEAERLQALARSLKKRPDWVDLVPAERTLLERLIPRRSTLRSDRRLWKQSGLAKSFPVPHKSVREKNARSMHGDVRPTTLGWR